MKEFAKVTMKILSLILGMPHSKQHTGNQISRLQQEYEKELDEGLTKALYNFLLEKLINSA